MDISNRLSCLLCWKNIAVRTGLTLTGMQILPDSEPLDHIKPRHFRLLYLEYHQVNHLKLNVAESVMELRNEWIFKTTCFSHCL